MEAFRYREKQAREAKRGLWGAAAPVDSKDTKAEVPKDGGRDKKEANVYVTRTGSKYHCEGCKPPRGHSSPARLASSSRIWLKKDSSIGKAAAR
jgi:hypothetical protein